MRHKIAGYRTIQIGDLSLEVPFEGTWDHEDAYFNHAEGYGEDAWSEVSVSCSLKDVEVRWLILDELCIPREIRGLIRVDSRAALDLIDSKLSASEWHNVEDYVVED